MNNPHPPCPHVAIACGGTGGHLFPGLAVGEQLLQSGCRVTLLVSPKQVDQAAVRGIQRMEVLTLPAVGLAGGRFASFAAGLVASYRLAKRAFQAQPPQAALAMGGFVSTGPILAAKRLRARTFLHESNTIPGRANRWLSRIVDEAFVGFPTTAARLHTRLVRVTGTPVRPQFRPREAAACRGALGLDPVRPVVVVVGGSQGARGINQLLTRSLPLLAKTRPQWQWLHLSGAADEMAVKQAYESAGTTALVLPFCSEMELALGAATAAVSRAGASSLAELAAMRVPAVLIPFPAATDDHQFHNARAFADSGAAELLAQHDATAERLAGLLGNLVENSAARARMQSSLGQWHAPQAADKIASAILRMIGFQVQDAPTEASSPQATSEPLGGQAQSRDGQAQAARGLRFA